jgi:hypothetical protein
LLITQFLFISPGWGSVRLGVYADLAQGCLWEYRVLLSSPVVCVFPSCLGAGGGTGALLVSPFIVEWECYTQAGGCGGVKVLPLLSGFSCKVYL